MYSRKIGAIRSPRISAIRHKSLLVEEFLEKLSDISEVA